MHRKPPRPAAGPGAGHRERPRTGDLRLHEGFVGDRKLIGTRYLDDPARREEYEHEIAPRTEAALARTLNRLYGGESVRASPRRCLDLGAGTGAAGRAVAAFFSRRSEGHEVELVSVDRVPGPGILVADLAREDGLPWLGTRFDLIVEAHLLNELYVSAPQAERASRAATLVGRWSRDHLAPQGVLLLVEPALRETSRLLLAVRDELVAHGELHVLGPCLTQAPCPARENPHDWCHDAAPAAAKAGVRPTRVDFSYLALTTAPTPVADASAFRVVSDRLEEKGRLRLYGCGPAGRTPIIRLDKHASDLNGLFDRLARGDRVTVEETTTAADGLRVLPTSRVTPRGG